MKNKDFKLSNFIDQIVSVHTKDRSLNNRIVQDWNIIFENYLIYQKLRPVKISRNKLDNKISIHLISDDIELKYNFEYHKKIIIDNLNLYFGKKEVIEVRIKN